MKIILKVVCFIIITVTFLTGCAKEPDTNGVDLDLSGLSITMVQAEYERIISNADDYIGKTIKVFGSFRTYLTDDAGGIAYYVIIIPGDDCCQMGFEFKRDGNYTFPDDYPAQNSMILISGTLDRHEVFNSLSLYISVDEFTVAGK